MLIALYFLPQQTTFTGIVQLASMSHFVALNVNDAAARLNIYKHQFPQKAIPESFEFTDLLIAHDLDKLAALALHPDATLAIYYAYGPIFLDLMARWVQNPAWFERNYCESQGITNLAQGSIILLALSRVIGLAPESTNLIEHFLESHKEEVDIDVSLPPSDLQALLLAFYRIYTSNPHKFKHFIDLNKLYNVIYLEDEAYNVSKMIAIRILSRYLNSSEESQAIMIQKHVKGSFEGSFDGQSQIDYRFLPLIEAKRFSNHTRLPTSVSHTQSGQLKIHQNELSSLVTCVCGVLLFNKNSEKKQTEEEQFVPIEGSVEVLRCLASHLLKDKPVLLHGEPGSGKTFLINQMAKYMNCSDSIVKIHLGEQTDAKLLLGTYTSGDTPGSFQWRSGVLTTAVKEGKWILVEDIDKAPTEVLSILLVLLEKRELNIPSRGEIIKAHSGFQLISTISTLTDRNSKVPDMIGLRLWEQIEMPRLSEPDLKAILTTKFPIISKFIPKFITLYNRVLHIFSMPAFISLNKGSHPRSISARDLIKFCRRCDMLLRTKGATSDDYLLESLIYESIFAEAVECFGSALTEASASVPLMNAIGEVLEISSTRINVFIDSYVPSFHVDNDTIEIGRALLQKSSVDKALLRRDASRQANFARTKHLKRLMEQIAVAVQMVEPVLLVGETGTGKTTVVQEVAKMMNKKLTAINVSQQTESSDLLGGFKPVNTMTVAIPLQESFESLFLATFSQKKNVKFSELLSKCFNKKQWKNVSKLWKEAVKMARATLEKAESPDPGDTTEGAPKKKRKLSSSEKSALLEKWLEFNKGIENFEAQAASLESSFVFNFVEGSLVKAVRNGEWLLLDEINLASSDTLESIADLLSEVSDQRSILLSERGDVEAIKAHPDFRIFGCMNPSTDVGKRDLPASIRSRFSEIYVHSPDRDKEDLLQIIDKYIDRYAVGDDWVADDIAELYLEAKSLSEKNKIVDGANQKPHFSIRTLTRTLTYVRDIVTTYGLRRSLYEGFCMSFLTLLDAKSENLLKPIIEKYTIGKTKNPKSALSQIPKAPSGGDAQYTQFRHYWLKKGAQEIDPQPNYIITPFVEKNLLNLVRATASRRFPVLIQGPTSAGKTSMIKYLAGISGHSFVRINNHEHTDLQEYLGTYVSDSSGKLVFREGVLVEALRKGYWIVLDELNLAPTDVLEALNRLLDDNRELFIPETQEVIHPHPDFMLFATQNPPGLYGGRKVLSRAFRNRFLELHFDDIPKDELEIILKDRCQIAPSYGKKIVEVYKELSLQRQSSRLFEQKNSFATLRDLFRWALRDAVGYEELAANGYMLLAERVRNDDEKLVVKNAIEKVMRVKLDMDAYYEKLENRSIFNVELPIVWTKAMRRLAVLVETSMKYKEPLLLVGETGCGKTTVCQIIAQIYNKQLITVNAHQNTETGDILGAQRPLRNRFEIRGELVKSLVAFFEALNLDIKLKEANAEDLTKIYRQTLKKLTEDDRAKVSEELISKIEDNIRNAGILFEWVDGPLVQAMKSGNLFLLDEISLADDSVLERLNSVLEPERSLMLAEKGTDDAFLVAHDDFNFLATMNPGGDYGKKELSPALRNRFTEIWVPSMEDFNDVKHIVKTRLKPEVEHLYSAITDFSEWFGKKLGNGVVNNGVISLRDILAWVEFINSCGSSIPVEAAFYHGASMVFIDALGTNNTAFLAENQRKLADYKAECSEKLGLLISKDLDVYSITKNHCIEVGQTAFRAGLFEIPRVNGSDFNESFNLHAPTTAANTLRVIRAMQVHKPILLEGSPGVGKTSLISAIAKATGNELIRINLSEQTDLIDLFGSDAPVDGGQTGEFVWRDAPFLRAMKNGEWVLLDEMNLASQSVLEGLNACLDHRGEAYIPELDRSFPRHPDFKVFAAQNPQYQGGGRKGLPKSFVNRFSVVFVDTLSADDLTLIAHKIYPSVSEDICEKLVTFVAQLDKAVVKERSFGSLGGPWEFNLRDVLRWLSSYNSFRNVKHEKNTNIGDFLNMIICQRFRTTEDRSKVEELFQSIFGEQRATASYYGIGYDFVQAGSAVIKRSQLIQHVNSADRLNLISLQCNIPVLESAIRSINENIPLIISGPSNSGKTELIRFIANVVGVELAEFAMNSDVDSMDILGGYEQVDVTRAMSDLMKRTYLVFRHLAVENCISSQENPTASKLAFDLMQMIETSQLIADSFSSIATAFKAFISQFQSDKLAELAVEFEKVDAKRRECDIVRFEWFDGLLVKAVANGDWLVLDNANLCNPSVLDRLNSLLETNGSLIINECSAEDGMPRVLTPHPNFRLFLTVNTKYGELSRAMRNRCIEVHIDELSERATLFDRLTLGVTEPSKAESMKDICDLMNNLEFGTNKMWKPLAAFMPSNESTLRRFATILDAFNLQEKDLANSALASNLALCDLNFIESLASSILHCSEFDNSLRNASENLLGVLRVLSNAEFFVKCEEEYKKIESCRITKGFTRNQAINTLLNEAIIYYLSAGQSVDWLQPTLMFHVADRLYQNSLLLKSIQRKASEGKLQQLSFIELSAAAHFGRGMKKIPKANVFGFVERLQSWAVDTFMVHATASVTFDEPIFSALLELLDIWSSLVRSAGSQNLTKLRVYHDSVKAWFEQNKFLVQSTSQELPHATISLDLELTTGTSMTTIWDAFRQLYPETIEAWEYYKKLLSILTEFDTLVSDYDMSVEDVSFLRQQMIDLFGTIIDGSASDTELATLFEYLNGGVAKIREAVKGSAKRHNVFESEFTMISNFVETNSFFSGIQTLQTQLKLLAKSEKPTLSLFYANSSALYEPYPRLFDNLWTKGQQLGINGLFGDALFAEANTKCKQLDKCEGRFLDKELEDMRLLAAAIIKNSQSVLYDQKKVFLDLLIDWIRKILEAHDISLPAVSRGQDKESLYKEIIETVIKSGNEILVNIFRCYFGPAIVLTNERSSLLALGKAWVLFSSGCIQLFVPSSPMDPAIDDHVAYDISRAQRETRERLLQSWKSIREASVGDIPTPTEIALSTMNCEERKSPRIFRPTDDIDQVFEEWTSFMSSSIDETAVKNLLICAENYDEMNLNRINVFQHNSSNFLSRLRTNQIYYSDLNDILAGYVYGLKLGMNLMVMEKENSKAQLPYGQLWSTSLSTLLNSSQLEQTFELFMSASKSMDAGSVEVEKLMLFFLNLSFLQYHEASDLKLDYVINLALRTLYYRWYYRRAKEEEQASQEASLYKHHDNHDDVDREFQDLFPDYEDVMEVDSRPIKSNSAFSEFYPQLCDSYVNFFLRKTAINTKKVVHQGAKLAHDLSKVKNMFAHGTNHSDSMAALLSSMLDLHETYSTQESNDVDFYHGESPFEFRRAMKVVSKIYNAVASLLNQWPEHATLQNISRVAEEFMQFPSNNPVSRLLQKVEVIFTYINEWEKFASSKVTLKESYEELTKLIVSWRKLELHSWKKLFENEDSTHRMRVGKWWFYLFETIVVPIMLDEELKDTEKMSTTQLLGALNIFMSETTYGEYVARLELVKAFMIHVSKIDGGQKTADTLFNFTKFYEQFVPNINETISQNKRTLEKEVSEVILLASWKDVNIDALKQSSRRSHSSLFKIVRKYRAILATPVSPLIQSGLSVDCKVEIPNNCHEVLRQTLLFNHEIEMSILKTCAEVSSWNERPNRLKNLSIIQKNMRIFIEKVDRSSAPSLYAYTKEITEEMERLKKETPKVMNDETKKAVAALRTQKHKLLSEVLKEMRRIGVKTTVKPDIKKALGTVNLILTNSSPFSTLRLMGYDEFFMRVLDLLPRLRAAVSQGNEEIPHGDLERGLAASENLMFNLVTVRRPIVRLTLSIENLRTLEESFATFVAKSLEKSFSLCKSFAIKPFFESVGRIRIFLKELDTILDYIFEVIRCTVFFTENFDSTVFQEIKDSVSMWKSKLQFSAKTIPTEDDSVILSSHEENVKKTVVDLGTWKLKNPEFAFIADIILSWLIKWSEENDPILSDELIDTSSLESLEKELRKLSNSILVSVQKVVELHEEDISMDEDAWLQLSQQRLSNSIKALHHEKIVGVVELARSVLLSIKHSGESSTTSAALIAFTMPLIQSYRKLASIVLDKCVEDYVHISRSTYILATSLHNLASSGFCSPEPPQEQKEDDNLHEGTGLGDGEGATNSKDAEEEEDLDEHAQQANEENKKDEEDDDGDNEDAVEMEGDMAGDLEEASDQENDQESDEQDQDLDEEVDDIDDLDPNAVDEKMWDEEAKDDSKEKDSDKMPQHTQNDDDNMEANEDEENHKERDGENEKDNDEKQDEEGSGDEEDVGEQEDEVKNDANEDLDEFVPETETLDLPEDMNLDDEAEDKEQEEENDADEFDDGLDDQDEMGDDLPEKMDEVAKDDEQVDSDIEEEEDAMKEVEEDDASDVENRSDEEGQKQEDSEEEDVKGPEEAPEEQEDEKDSAEKGDREAAGLEDAEDEQDENVDMNAASKAASGEKGDGADSEVLEEKEDIGASGADFELNQMEDKEKDSNENPNNEIQESLKQLGDSLKEFHRRREEIKDASQHDEQEQESKADVMPDEFEHVEGENTERDTQALGAADNQDQIQKIDEENAIDDEEDTAVKMEENKDDAINNNDDMEVDDKEPQEETENANEEVGSENLGAFVGERRVMKEEEQEIDLDLDDAEETRAEHNMRTQVDEDWEIGRSDVPIHDINEARELWNQSELATQELSSGLCEQLRLILEPTLATKLRGDYKTGKRLNMKRIIPYIASDFRKDKIWLRRTKPSKRQYQIMISVDNSKSMSESKVTELTMHSIALVSKALTQLESGGLSIVRFGEDVKLIHPFDKPFNQETGARVFQWLDFQQDRTDIKQLCSKSLKIFENARATSGADLWQLQIIISDGVCEDHETVERMVRQAREEKVMLVFVIIDGISSNESILDMSQVSYVPDANTGAMSLKVNKYLDTFPFDFYVVVRSINELPEMLSLILRQYFTEVAST